MDWWHLTKESKFADCILLIARNPQQGFSAWKDGKVLITFLSQKGKLNYDQPFIYENEFLEAIEKALIGTIKWASCDTLSNLVDLTDEAEVPQSIKEALHMAVLEIFEDNRNAIIEDDSEHSLSDRIENLKNFARHFEIPSNVLTNAISETEDRILELRDQENDDESFNYPISKDHEKEKFDDNDLRNLFTPLLDN